MRTITLALILVVSVAPVWGEETARPSLAGIDRFMVLVESLHEDAREFARLYSTSIQTDVELRLRQNGIKVLTKNEVYDLIQEGHYPSEAYLYVYINFLKLRGRDSCIYTIRLEFKQAVLLNRNPELPSTIATTWSGTGGTGITPCSEANETIRSALRDQVDEFINDYLAVNPKD